MTPPHPDGHTHGGGGHGGSFDSDQMIEALEVEGRLGQPLLEAAALAADRWLAANGVEPRRIIDLGCGPGVGTVDLAERFPSASVTGVDAAAPMLARAAARAAGRGLGGRVEVRQLDLEDDLTVLGPADLVVAAMSIHHVADEVATLRHIRSLIEPSGVLCVLERAEPMAARLGDEFGRPGIWERFESAWLLWFETKAQHLPGAHNVDRYPQLLDEAGFELLEVRSLAAVVDAPDDAASEHFVMQQLGRTAAELEGHADPADLAALGQYLDHRLVCPDHVARLAIRMSRKLFIARAA